MTDKAEKIDNPKLFDSLISDQTTTKLFSKNAIDKYNFWFNQFKDELNLKDRNDISWIAENYQKIENLIRNSNYKPKSIITYTTTLVKILLYIDKYKFKDIARNYILETKSMQKSVEIKKLNNVLDQDQIKNFVHFNEIIEKREHYLSKLKENPTDIKLNQYALILALNSYIPALRLDLLGINIVHTKPTDKTNNYIYIDNDKNVYIIINTDKVSHKKGSFTIDLNKDDIVDGDLQITDKEKLKNLIKFSLNHIPRTKLLFSDNNVDESLSKKSYYRKLNDIFKPVKVTQNVFRRSYINYFYRKNITNKAKNRIANYMRNSWQEALKSYYFVNADEKKLSTIPPPPIIPKKSEAKFDRNRYMKEYRLKNKTKLNEQRKFNRVKNKDSIAKNRRLYNYNNKNIIPRPTTLIKHGIIHNEETGKYEYKED